MEYVVVYARDLDDLAENVTDLMRDGWVCQCGVFATTIYYQAMTRTK